MKKLIAILLVLSIPVVVYFSGPRFEKPVLNHDLPQLAIDISNVESYVRQNEASYQIRPDNEARIIWNNDSLKNKTEFCILYLPGFSATWYEGYPVNINLSKYLGANAYFARLAAHGLVTNNPLIDMYPADLYQTAKEALIIAKSLGEKVIVMGTSTGGTLAIQLAADFPDMVNSLILLSPNFAINNPAAFLLSGPWGLQIGRTVGGTGDFRILKSSVPSEDYYWYQKYRWEGAVYLEQLVEIVVKKEVFQKVTQPVFMGYYYKNEKEQDQTVKVSAMLEMFNQLGTPNNLKVKVAFPNAGNHVIGNRDLSKCSNEVEMEVIGFVKKIIL